MEHNLYLQDLLHRLEARYANDRQDMSLGDWVCENTHLNGKKFNFNRYPFQKQIMDDMHPNLDCIKPSQVGLSEVQIRKTLAFLARNNGTVAIFTLPNEKMYKRSSQGRIMPVVESERAFNLEQSNGVKPTRSMGAMQIGRSWLYVTGSTEGDATSISADMVMNDEVDLTDQQMLALFNSRLQNSDYRVNQRFSTATHANFGIDAGFRSSDQHEYMCKCTHCNHWQIPDFDKKWVDIPGLPDTVGELHEIDEGMIDAGLDLVNAQVVCEKCRMPLELGKTEYREWVPRFPNRTHARGYQVLPFSTDRLNIQYIISQLLRYKKRDYLRGWYNTVLGRAYTDSNARLRETDIEACFTSSSLTPEFNAGIPAWVGIDMGQTCHIVVAIGYNEDSLQTTLLKSVPVEQLANEVREIMATYNVVGGMLDRHPYTPTANEIRDISNGLILPCEYRGQKEVNHVMDLTDNQKIDHIQMNRTMLLDDVARIFRLHKIRIAGYGTQKLLITEHLRDMVRDESPETPATWIKLTGNDHYFHSFAFMLGAVKINTNSYGRDQENRTMIAVAGVNMNTNNHFTNLLGSTHKSKNQSPIITNLLG